MEVCDPLSRVNIVLVDTRYPANIGATARVMMNMGLSRLVLVRPPQDRSGEARRLAAGAEAVLDRAAVVPDLSAALRGQNLVFGTSRHAGRLRRNICSPRQAAARMVPLLPLNRISIVFGNEVNGLENEDLKLCSEIIAIPSSERFPSLNLSHAVMVVAYELFTASPGAPDGDGRVLAAQEDIEQFSTHLEETLVSIGFLEPGTSGRIMFTLRQLFSRAQLDAREVQILRGILSAMNAKRRH